MSWLALWLTAVITAGSRGCLKCSPEAIRILNEVKGPYLNSKLHGDPALRVKLQNLLQSNIDGLSRHPIQPGLYMGTIDEITLKQLTGHFRRSMKRIMENQFDGGQLFNEITWSLQDLLVNFKKLLASFQKVTCSNECGSMTYLFTQCFSCRPYIYGCHKKFYCGERKLKVEADEDMILDCAMRWHRYNHGLLTYSFYRIVAGEELEMATTMDSFLVKKEANANDTGRYRCKLFGPKDLKSMMDFQVTVVPSVGKTTWLPRPQPTLEVPLTVGISSRAPLPQPDWTVWIVIGTTGGLLFLIVAAFLWYYRHQNEKEEGEESSDDEEEESESSEQAEN